MTASIRKNRTNEIIKDGFEYAHNASLYMWTNNLPSSQYYVWDDDWRDREGGRQDLIDLTAFGLTPITDHFLHLSHQDTGVGTLLVSFTENEEKGARDRQASPIRIGSYLTKFYPQLSSDEVTQLAGSIQAKHRHLVLKFAVTAEEIRDVYIRCHQWDSVQSCMTGKGRWGSMEREGHHPVDAYGDSDLQLAYVEKHDRIIARCIVWPERKIFSRIYGEFEKMKPLLKELGYRNSNLDGAKLRKIPYVGGTRRDREMFVCPYLDGPHYVRVEGDHLVICEYEESPVASGTDGYVTLYTRTCAVSGERINSCDQIQLAHPLTLNEVFIHRRFNTDEHVWRDINNMVGRDVLRISQHMHPHPRYGSVPAYAWDYLMSRCEVSGERYLNSDMIRTSRGRVHLSIYYQQFVVCQVTRDIVHRDDAVWMEHGAWWSRYAFDLNGIEVEGKFYARELRNAA